MLHLPMFQKMMKFHFYVIWALQFYMRHMREKSFQNKQQYPLFMYIYSLQEKN